MKLTLKQTRLINEITQDEIAKAIGVHVQTYRKIESNPDMATIAQAKRISEFFKLDYDELFFGVNSTLSR